MQDTASRRTFQGRLWAALRRLRKATVPELVLIAARESEGAATGAAHAYIRALVAGGYVAVRGFEPPAAGRGAAWSRYMLIRDTGPLPPVWNAFRGTLRDRNTGAIHDLASEPIRERRAEQASGGHRQRIWDAVRALDEATVPEIAARAGIAATGGEVPAVCRKYMQRLAELGHVERAGRAPHPSGRGGFVTKWRVVGRLGPVAPGLTGPGHSLSDTYHDAKGTAAARIWAAVRDLREFTAADVIDRLSWDGTATTRQRVQRRLRLLGDAGYLTCIGREKPRLRGSTHKVWKLVRDTGPLPPAFDGLGCARDRNTGEVFVFSEQEGAP